MLERSPKEKSMIHHREHLLEMPIYPTAEAGRLVGLHPARVSRWLQGYHYPYTPRSGQAGVHRQAPVLSREKTPLPTYASFLELIELLFVKRFVDNGMSLQKVRKALEEVKQKINTKHFAQQIFFTNGHDIFLKMEHHGNAIMQMLANGQWVIAPVIQELGHRIEFDQITRVATRWYPLKNSKLVVLDPHYSFGRPSLSRNGIATANIYDLYLAEKKKIERVCSWFDIDKDEVKAAVSFEERAVA